MKYTKIAVHVGLDYKAVQEIDKALGREKFYEAHSDPSSCGYLEDHCINLEDSCHCSREWYEKQGYKIVSIEEFWRIHNKTEVYEIY